MSYEIIVSKKGYNVLTETNPKNFILDSRLNHLKTAVPGTMQIVVNASSTNTDSVVHGLGINPLVIAYFNDSADSKWRVPVSQPDVTNIRYGTSLNVEVYITDTRVYFKAINRYGTQKTVNIQYEIFYEGDA